MHHSFGSTSRRWLAVLLVLWLGLPLLTAGAQPAPAHTSLRVQTPWPMFGFDPAHTHFNPYEHLLSPANVSRLTLDWTTNVGASGICAAPAVADGLLYLNDGSGSLDAFDGKIGKITPGGQVTEYPLPGNAGYPQNITSDPDGNLWFTDPGTNSIGKITEYVLPTQQSGPNDITAGPGGNLRFTEYKADQVGQITSSGQITEYVVTTEVGNGPTSMTNSPTGLWFIQSFDIGQLIVK